MPSPQLNSKIQTRERPTYEEMVWENLQETKTEVRETRRELNGRVDKLEEEIKSTRQELNARMDKLEEEIKSTRQELNARMDKIETRMDNLDGKIDETRRELSNKIDDLHKELGNKIDGLHKEIKSSTGHISIANISTVGIALAVIYAVLK